MTREEAVALLERYSNYDGMGIPNLAGCKEAMKVAVDALKEAFPELAESEDERIRKTLIHIVKGACDKYGIKYKGDEITEEKLLSYLEKQKEQKPKFNVGDTIRLKNSYAEYTIENISDGKYYCKGCSIDIDGCDRDYELVRQKPAEWSEEDEKNLNDIIHFFESLCSCLATEERHAENRKWLKFLKSLRPSWKPSEEQMRALKYVTKQWEDGKGVACPSSFKYHEITELYEQLKKLM